MLWQLFKISDKFSNYHTPFLGLKARLSQSWAAPSVLMAVVFLVKLQLLRSTIQAFIDIAEKGTLELCSAANSLAQAESEAPRTAARMANKLIDQSLTHSVKTLLELLAMIVTALKGILLFVIEIYIGTWACLTVSFVNIAANEALNATESVVHFANKTVQAAVHGVEEGLEELEKIVNGATGLIGTIESFVSGSEKQISKVNFSIGSLEHLDIPSSINADLEKLRTRVPTYEGVKTELEDIVSIPFGLVVSKIKSSNVTIHAGKVQLPPSRTVSTCNLTDVSIFYDHCSRAANTAVGVLTALVCIGIVSLIFYNIFSENRKWNRHTDVATRFKSPQGADELNQEMRNLAAISVADANIVARTALKFTSKNDKLKGSPLISWYIQFITYRPALSALAAGLLILVLSLFEFIVVKVLSSETKKLGDFIARSMNDTSSSMKNDLMLWQSSTNGEIRDLQDQVNTEILDWVSSSTQTVNNTLQHFMTSMNNEIDKVFGKTPFYKPLSVVVDCLIGNKVEKMETGLTWIHKKAQVSFPQISIVNDTIWKNQTKIVSANQKTDTVLPFVVNALYDQIQSEAIVGFVFVGVWCLFAIGGGIYVFLQNDNYTDEDSIGGEYGDMPFKRETQFFEGPHRKPTLKSPAKIPDQYGNWHSTVDSYCFKAGLGST